MVWFFVAVLALFFFFIKKKNEEVVFGEKEYQDWKRSKVVAENLFSSLKKNVGTFEFDKTLNYLYSVLSKRKRVILVDFLPDRVSIEKIEKKFLGVSQITKEYKNDQNKLVYHRVLDFQGKLKTYSERLLSVFSGFSVFRNNKISNYTTLFNGFVTTYDYECVSLSFLDFTGNNNISLLGYYSGGKVLYIRNLTSGKPDEYYKLSFDTEDEALFFCMFLVKMYDNLLNDYDKKSF